MTQQYIKLNTGAKEIQEYNETILNKPPRLRHKLHLPCTFLNLSWKLATL